MKKILFLTAPYGYGHIVPTKALQREFARLGYETKIYDIIQEWNPTLSNVTQKLYQSMYKTGFRRIYQFWYWATDNSIIGDLIISMMKLVNKRKLRDNINEYKPDGVICMFPSWALYKLLENYQVKVPIYTVVTDFYMHKFWFHCKLKRFFIANTWTFNNINFDIPYDSYNKFTVTGIPIQEEFEELFQSNINNNKIIYNKILLLAGSTGVNKEYLKLALLLRKILPSLSIILICGNNKSLYNKAVKYSNKNLEVHGFCDDMLNQYQKVDLVVTKSGGNTVSELAALAKPGIFYNPLYGQEMQNARFFESEGTSYIVMTKNEVLSIIVQLYQNTDKILAMRKNYLKIFKPRAADKIVKIIEKDLQ